ncbi:hypothetical protein Q6296_29485, partial [Klebsiella variicola]
ALRTLGEEGPADSGGIHLWKALPEHWKGPDFVRKAREAGLNVVAQDSFQAGDGEPARSGAPHIRLSLGRSRSRFEL